MKFGFAIILLTFSLDSFAVDYKPSDCPIVGNIESKIFHVSGGKSYAKMLVQNKGSDNRKCFKTEEEASAAGYRKAKR